MWNNELDGQTLNCNLRRKFAPGVCIWSSLKNGHTCCIVVFHGKDNFDLALIILSTKTCFIALILKGEKKNTMLNHLLNPLTSFIV